jgi:hypothetical protein
MTVSRFDAENLIDKKTSEEAVLLNYLQQGISPEGTDVLFVMKCVGGRYYHLYDKGVTSMSQLVDKLGKITVNIMSTPCGDGEFRDCLVITVVERVFKEKVNQPENFTHNTQERNIASVLKGKNPPTHHSVNGHDSSASIAVAFTDSVLRVPGLFESLILLLTKDVSGKKVYVIDPDGLEEVQRSIVEDGKVHLKSAVSVIKSISL